MGSLDPKQMERPHARVYFTILKVRGTSACYESELHIGLYFINILILRSA